MKRLEEFRIFYNHTIHPELQRLERKRMRLLILLAISIIALVGLFVLELYIGILALTLTLMIPVALYIGYLIYRVRKFVQTFKPHVVNLILDFIDDGLNYGTLSYDAKKSIPKQTFLASHIFKTPAPYYVGEDFITGKVGALTFDMCELDVKEISPVSNSLSDVFRGVFLHATFEHDLEGVVIVWPRKYRQQLVASIKNVNFLGAKNVDHEILCEEFRETYMTYATPDTHVVGMLPITMQEAIIEYLKSIDQYESSAPSQERSDRDFFMSFINNHIFVAFSEEKDLLEPFILRSNLSFELVREFFEDIHLLLRIVEDFDQTH